MNLRFYYKDNTERTISISNAVGKIFTNEKDPLRMSLEKVIELRNTSTHYITEEYGIIYAPIFQACVLNFRNKMYEFHNVDVADYIPENFLALSVNLGDFSDEAIRAKYSPELAEKLIMRRNDLMVMEQSTDNPKFSIAIRREVYLTKQEGKADLIVAANNKVGDKEIQIVKELKDPSNTHNMSFKHVVEAVNNRFSTDNIDFSHRQANGEVRNTFNTADLTLFIRFYDLKNNEKYAYTHKIGDRVVNYSYAPVIVDFIIEQIKKDPNGIIDRLKSK